MQILSGTRESCCESRRQFIIQVLSVVVDLHEYPISEVKLSFGSLLISQLFHPVLISSEIKLEQFDCLLSGV